jgi:hypothetical protein
MKKIVVFMLILIFVCHSAVPLQAQNVKIGAEFGYDMFFGGSKKPDMVRENKSLYPYYDYYYCGFIVPEQTINISYFGLKSEFFFMKIQVGISAVLSLSLYSSVLDSDKDYFLWQVGHEGVNTDYVRIRNIKQSSYYVGLPLEIRFFPKRQEMPVKLYFKIGSVFNLHVHTKNHVDFQDDAMNYYSESINNQIEKPNNFSAYLYPAVGLKIGGFKVGNSKFPWINIETHFPGILISSNASAFFESDPNSNENFGIGIQFSVQIPLFKNNSKNSK